MSQKTVSEILLMHGDKFSVVILNIILLFLLCSAIHSQTEKNNTSTSANKNYKIGVGDVLKVVVTKQSLLSIDNVRVSNEGTIRLPMIEGDISAVCLTEADLTAAVTDRYKKYLLNPQVYIAVQEFNSNPVAVIGAVNTPGRFDIQRPTRLLELLTFVNGPSATAGEDIQIFRNPNADRCQSKATAAAGTEKFQELLVLPMAEVMKGNESANPFVQAGDIITVAKAEEPGEAYIIGNVKEAKTILLKEPTTLSKALAMSGGVTDKAEIEKIKIIRQDPINLVKKTIVANLKEIDKDKQKDILLQPNDIVEVPGPTGTKKILRDIFKTVIPTVGRSVIPIL